MHSDDRETAGPAIGLSEMIESLRRELQTAVDSGKDHVVAFDVDKVEMELRVTVTRKAKGEGGVAFWVVKAGASVEAGRDAMHTFKLTLSPVLSATSARLRVASTTDESPSRD